MALIKENLSLVLGKIRVACEKTRRDPSQVQIIAVSKTQSVERIKEAAAAGLKLFAENRIQEAKTKLPALKELGEWHLIGHLQSNKAKNAMELFDVIESVDSLSLAEHLSNLSIKTGRTLNVCAEVNISGEEQKHGFKIEQAYEVVSRMADLPNIKLIGLMTMAPLAPDAETTRPVFSGLRNLAEKLLKNTGPLILSMGMSNDYMIAVEEGATHLRIGTALFK